MLFRFGSFVYLSLICSMLTGCGGSSSRRASQAGVFSSVDPMDASQYAANSAGIQTAINTACKGDLPGEVIFSASGSPPIQLTSQITVPSNCTLLGPGRNKLTLQAAANYSGSSPLLLINGAAHVRLQGFTIDGNRTNNATGIGGNGLEIDGASSDIGIQDVGVNNFAGEHVGIGIAMSNVSSTVSGVTITDSEISNNGPALPDPNGCGIDLGVQFQPASYNTVNILRNRIHGNNLGICGWNNSSSTTNYDVLIAENSVYSNASSGINVYTFNQFGSTVSGWRVEDNDSFCNGWPANGAGFPPACSAGLLQTGPNTSSSGVGIENIGPLLNQVAIIGNRTHDNVYDGISVANNMTLTVNTNGTIITCTSCGITTGSFDTNWQAGRWVQIADKPFQIASVSSPTSLTLQTSPGTLPGAIMLAPTNAEATIFGNISYNNGNVLTGGTGILDFYSDGVTLDCNQANHNSLEGIGLYYSASSSVATNEADDNDQQGSGTHNAGYLAYNTFKVSFVGDSSRDDGGGTEAAGLLIAGGVDTYVDSPRLAGSAVPIIDDGTNTTTTELPPRTLSCSIPPLRTVKSR